MRKRVLVGFACAAILTTMLPGAAMAGPRLVANAGRCVATETLDRAAFYDWFATVGGPNVLLDDDIQIKPADRAAFKTFINCYVPNGATPT